MVNALATMEDTKKLDFELYSNIDEKHNMTQGCINIFPSPSSCSKLFPLFGPVFASL